LDAISIVIPIFTTAKITLGLIVSYFGDYSNTLREFSKHPSKACSDWAKSIFDNPEFCIPNVDSTSFENKLLKDFILLLLSGIIYVLVIVFILHVSYLSKTKTLYNFKKNKRTNKKVHIKPNLSLCTIDQKQNSNDLVEDLDQPLLSGLGSAQYDTESFESSFKQTRVINEFCLNFH